MTDLKNNLPEADLILVGNKCDDESPSCVPREQAEELVNKYNLSHFLEVSAKSGKGIIKLVEVLSKDLFKKH